MATRLFRILAVPAFLGALSTSAMAQSQQPSYSCEDDGTSQVANNVSGTTDKVLTLTPSGSNTDKEFKVEVVNGDGVVTAFVEYTDGNTPPITVPPGSTARVVDTQDSDTKKPKGSVSFV